MAKKKIRTLYEVVDILAGFTPNQKSLIKSIIKRAREETIEEILKIHQILSDTIGSWGEYERRFKERLIELE